MNFVFMIFWFIAGCFGGLFVEKELSFVLSACFGAAWALENGLLYIGRIIKNNKE